MKFSKGETTYFVPVFKNDCLNLSKSAMRILNCLVLPVKNPAPFHQPQPVGRKQKCGGFHPHPFPIIVLPGLVNFGVRGSFRDAAEAVMALQGCEHNQLVMSLVSSQKQGHKWEVKKLQLQ